MKRTDTKITRYEDGEFFVDIIETEHEYEAVLTRKGYGVSELMFGTPKEQQTFDDFLETVEASLPEYEATYDEQYKEDWQNSKFAAELAFVKGAQNLPEIVSDAESFEIDLAEQLYRAISDGNLSVDPSDVEAEWPGCDDLEGYEDKLNFYCGMAASYVFGELYQYDDTTGAYKRRSDEDYIVDIVAANN